MFIKWTKIQMQPCGKAGKAQPVQIGDGGAAANRRKIAFVEVVKRAGFSRRAAGARSLRDISALLNRGLRHAGQGFSRLMAEIRKIADHENFGMARHGEIRLYDHASCFVDRRARFLGQDAPKRRTPARPRPTESCAWELSQSDRLRGW